MDKKNELTGSQQQIIEQLMAEFVKTNSQKNQSGTSSLQEFKQNVYAKAEREKCVLAMFESYDKLAEKQLEEDIARLDSELKELGLCAKKSGTDIRVSLIEKTPSGNSFVIQHGVMRKKSEEFGDYFPCGTFYKSYSPTVDYCNSLEEYLSTDCVVKKVKELYNIYLNRTA